MIYHKTTTTGFNQLIYDFQSNDCICCSTEESTRLITKYVNNCDDFQIAIELELNSDSEIISYTKIDTDADKDFGYDEIRISFKNGILKNLKTIYMTEDTYKWLNPDENSDYDGMDEYREFLINLFEDFNYLIEIIAENGFYNL